MQIQNPIYNTTLFLTQNNPFNMMAKILSLFDFLMKNQRPRDHSYDLIKFYNSEFACIQSQSLHLKFRLEPDAI